MIVEALREGEEEVEVVAVVAEEEEVEQGVGVIEMNDAVEEMDIVSILWMAEK